MISTTFLFKMEDFERKKKVLVLQDIREGKVVYNRIRIMNQWCRSCEIKLVLIIVIFGLLAGFIINWKAY